MRGYRVTRWYPFVSGAYLELLGLAVILYAGIGLTSARTAEEVAYYALWLAIFGPTISFLGHLAMVMSVEAEKA